MVLFRISGSLPAPWEDFICADETAAPHITLMTKANAEVCGEENGDGSDGWLDIVVDAPAIDLELARRTIADALGITADDVVIEEAGLCQSV